MTAPNNKPAAARSSIQILDWGPTEYSDGLARQEALVARRRAGDIGDTLVLTEHAPVYTIGRRKEPINT